MPYLIMSGLLWGTGGLTGTLFGRAAGLPGLSVAAYRLATGGLLIVSYLLVTGRRWPAGRAAWTRITVLGLLAAVFQSCYFTAVSVTSVSLATLLTIGSAPLIVLAAGTLTGRRRPSRRVAVTTGLALAGLGLLVGLPGGGYPEAAVLGTAGLAVTSGAGFAAMTLISARPVAGLDDLAAAGFGFTLGGLLLLPLATVAGRLAFTPHPAAIGLLLALGTGPTAVAYTLYFRGLRTASPSAAALLSLLEPLTGTILAVVLLGNRLGGAGIAGAVLLGAAVVATVRTAGRSGDRLAHHAGGPVQHDRAQRHQYGERLPHRGAGERAGRQRPGRGHRVVERVEVREHPEPGRSQGYRQQHAAEQQHRQIQPVDDRRDTVDLAAAQRDRDGERGHGGHLQGQQQGQQEQAEHVQMEAESPAGQHEHQVEQEHQQHRGQDRPGQDGEPADRGDPEPLDDPRAQLEDRAEAGAGPAGVSEQGQDAGQEQVQHVAGRQPLRTGQVP
jgi:DME family drug/metabolite transporter